MTAIDAFLNIVSIATQPPEPRCLQRIAALATEGMAALPAPLTRAQQAGPALLVALRAARPFLDQAGTYAGNVRAGADLAIEAGTEPTPVTLEEAIDVLRAVQGGRFGNAVMMRELLARVPS